MDQPQSEDENETHLLVDSGTESITESPVNEDESEQSEDLTVCDIRTEASKTKEKLYHPPNLLDKSFSIDEEVLAPPLEPIQLSTPSISNDNGSTNDDSVSDISNENDDGIVEEDYLSVEDKPEDGKLDERRRREFDGGDEGSQGMDDDEEDSSFVNKRVKVTVVNEEFEYSLQNIQQFPSILRRPSGFDIDSDSSSPNCLARRVSFPIDESALVSYREPDNCCQWMINKDMPNEKILQVYQNSCKKHQTIELDIIKNQIQDIKNNVNHSAILNLSSVKITSEVNETLEDLLKVTNFHTLVLHECKFTPETMSEFLSMLEYYESVCHIEVAMNFDDDDTWKCFCSAVSNIMVLESISFKGMDINDQYMRNLLHAIRTNSNITTLKFDGCMLVKLPNFYLIDCLMYNNTIRELCLPSMGLYTKEAETLGRFLQQNLHLRVLDISNNCIGDRGFEALAKGLIKQNLAGVGLSALVIFNNQITEKSGSVITTIILECKNLHKLNVGYNNLTDEVLVHIKNSLPASKTLEGLGLQCTLLTCRGMDYLAEAIQNNRSLQKINLKGNKAIQTSGVEKLCQALTNSKITKIEIDESNRSCSDPEAYAQAVVKLNAICTVNKSFVEITEEITNVSLAISRKVSLSCEPRFTVPDPTTTTFQVGSPASSLSPMPSPVSSPAPKSRFQIVKVHESSISNLTGTVAPTTPTARPKSRFRVTRVPSSPEDDVSLGRFANVRSSVSSNDSVDSLTTLPLDTDSE